jgi:class 3 adenylate cyclase/tetratricopeptide (TPR) repeat protein
VGGADPSEIGTKTVLFTDVAGSTTQRSAMGDVEADRLERELHRLHETAIEGHAGSIVKSLGDGIMATFDGAANAIAAAVEIQTRVRDRNLRVEPVVGLRIGISTGDVSLDSDGDLHGTPVVEAARLCADATAGQILIADVVRVLAGTRGALDLVDLGSRQYKGLPAALATWEVRWDDADAPGPGLPSALSYDDDFGFVGRHRERARLEAAWKRVLTGQLSMVLVGGEPGAGKTRLTAEFARGVVASGATLLFGSCEDGLAVPYQPFVESIRHHLSSASRPRLGSQAGELARLVPDVADHVRELKAPTSSDPETERYQLFNAYVEMLADVATDAPVLLVLDDIHWATRPTLQLLRHIVRSRLAAPVMLVATYRETDVDDDHPLAEALADLHRSDSVDRVDVPGLDEAAIRDYLDGIAGYELDERADRLTKRVHDETDGNPFFMRELLLHLVEAGQLYLTDGRWEAAEGFLDAVPAGARDVIGQRLSRLGEDARALLARAAVIGVDFHVRVLRELVDIDEDAMFDVLERASAARLVGEVGVDRYRFNHALVRSALLDDLSASRRARLHRQIAVAIEASNQEPDEVVEELADHWLAAGDAGDPVKTIEFTHLAAQRATDHLAHDEAAVLLARALELSRRHGLGRAEEAELLTDLGVAQRLAGLPESRETLLAAGRLALAEGKTTTLVRSVLENARTAAVLDVDAERVELLEAALGALEREATPERARLLANLGFELSFTHDRDRVLALSDEALALAREVGDLADLAFVLSMRVIAFRSPDTLAERLAVCTELQQVSEQLDDPAMQFLAAFRRAEVLMDSADIASFRAVVATMQQITDRLGQPMMSWNTARRTAELALLDGDLDRAERLAGEMRKIGSELQLSFAEPIYVSFAAKIFNALGDYERSVGLWAPWVDRIHLIGFRFGLAHALILAGRPDEATAQWEQGAANDLADIDRDLSWLETMALAAEVACALGDERRARLVHDALAPHGGHLITSGVGAVCSSDHAIGVAALGAGDLDRATATLHAAVEHVSAAGAPLLAAASRARLAEALLRRGEDGDHAEATELLAEAAYAARTHGARGILDLVERVDPGSGP